MRGSILIILCIIRLDHLPQQPDIAPTRLCRHDRQSLAFGIWSAAFDCPQLELCTILCPRGNVGQCGDIPALLGICQ